MTILIASQMLGVIALIIAIFVAYNKGKAYGTKYHNNIIKELKASFLRRIKSHDKALERAKKPNTDMWENNQQLAKAIDVLTRENTFLMKRIDNIITASYEGSSS